MKSLLLLSVLALLSASNAPSSHKDSRFMAEVHNDLVGSWKLVSLEEPGGDGQLRKADCTGMFAFTSDGKASVQVMYRDAKTGSAYAENGDTKLPTAPTESMTLRPLPFTLMAHSCELSSAKT